MQEDREKEQSKREAEWRRKGELRRQFRCVSRVLRWSTSCDLRQGGSRQSIASFFNASWTRCVLMSCLFVMCREFYQRRWEEYASSRERLVELQKGYDSEDESNFDVKVVSRKMVPIGPPEEVPC